MRILMLGWELPPHNSGGLGVACYHMAKALAHSGAQIDFMVPYTADHEINFMNVIATDTRRPEQISGGYDGRCLTCETPDCDSHSQSDSIRTSQQRYVQQVSRYLSAQTPDVIHAHDWLTFEAGMEAKRKTGRPLVAHVHATEYDRAGGNTGNPVIHEIEALGLTMADRIIAVSHATKQRIITEYQIPSEKIEVIHNSVDATLAKQHIDSSEYLYVDYLKSQGYTVVASISRLTMQKGLTFLLDAASQVISRYDRVVFLIAGDGEQREELIRLSADYGISEHVIFPGFVRGRQWRDIYELADVFVMSSISEPFGLTALEAVAHETPVVLTKQSGVREMLHHSLSYEYWDTTRLADIIINLATSPELSKTLSDHALKEFRATSWDTVASRCIDQYSRVRVPA